MEGDGFGKRLKRGLTYATSAAKAGFKGASAGVKTGRFSAATLAAQQSTQGDERKVNDGGTILGSTFRGTHYQSEKADYKLKLDNLEAMTKAKKSLSTSTEDLKLRKKLDSIGAAITASGDSAAAMEFEAVKKSVDKAMRNKADKKLNDTQYTEEIKRILNDYNNGTKTTKNPDGSPKVEHIRPPKKGTVVVDVSSLTDEDTLELSEKAKGKWINIENNLNEARTIAKEISGTKIETKNEHGEVIDSVTIHYKEDTFADDIGDIADQATAAINNIKTSAEYKRAEANATESKK